MVRVEIGRRPLRSDHVVAHRRVVSRDRYTTGAKPNFAAMAKTLEPRKEKKKGIPDVPLPRGSVLSIFF